MIGSASARRTDASPSVEAPGGLGGGLVKFESDDVSTGGPFGLTSGVSYNGVSYNGVSDNVPIGVPAYFGPWELNAWGHLSGDRPAVVVLNPDNGPGRTPSPDYLALIESLRNRGIRTLVYVHTDYLRRDFDAIALDVKNALSWYRTDGIFFDEVPVEDTGAVRSTLAALESLSTRCAFNSGRVVPDSWYRRFPDATFVTFEGDPRQLAERTGPTRGIEGPPERQWWLLHSAPVSTHSNVWELFRTLGIGLAYVTDDRLPNPWDVYRRALRSNG
jgi:Spherulation-specific family 4